LKIAPSEIEAPGNLFAEGESSYVTGVGKLKGRLIILLDIAKLLHRPEFKRFEEAAETRRRSEVTLSSAKLRMKCFARRARAHGNAHRTNSIDGSGAQLLQTLVYQDAGCFFDERRPIS